MRIFEICFEIYELDPAHFLNAPKLTWQAALSNQETKVKLDLLTIINMVQKGIRGGIRHAIHRYVKANNNDIKNCDKNKES